MLAIQSDWMINKTTLAILQDAEPDIINFHNSDGTKRIKNTFTRIYKRRTTRRLLRAFIHGRLL